MPFRTISPHMSFVRKLSTKVPFNSEAILNCTQKSETPITQETVTHLERISLVDLGNIKGLKRLNSSIELANQIISVGTINVEPMVSVLDNRTVFLREDYIANSNSREEIMINATAKKEDYFVAPPGNIPLIPRKRIIKDDIESL